MASRVGPSCQDNGGFVNLRGRLLHIDGAACRRNYDRRRMVHFRDLMLYLLSIASIKWLRFRRFEYSRPRDPAFYEIRLPPARWARIRTASRPFRFRGGGLLAEFRAGPQSLIDELAVLFVIVRIAYVFTYIGNRPTLRSILWSIGFAINIAIFFLPAIRRSAAFRDGREPRTGVSQRRPCELGTHNSVVIEAKAVDHDAKGAAAAWSLRSQGRYRNVRTRNSGLNFP